MPSKYFVPKKGDLDSQTVEGAFFCEKCDALSDTAKHFIQSDMYGWKCPNGHTNSVSAESMYE